VAFAVLASFVFPALADDLRDGAPSDVFLATYHRHNTERDYLNQHYAHVWETIEETQIIDRFVEAVRKQMSEDDIAQFEEVWGTLEEAVAPIQWEALSKCTESLYAQKMEMPTSQHLLLLRVPDEGAASFAEGITNLFNLAEEASEGEVTVETSTVGDATLTWLQPPAEVPIPFSPCVGVMGDIFIFSSRQELARESIGLLGDPSAESKFDDERLTEALTHLPEMEDGVTFFDGRALFSQLGGISTFIRQQAGNEPDAERVATLIDSLIDEIDAHDFEVTVEYTEGYQNRSASFGRLAARAKDTVLGQMVLNQELFEDWSRWVPENATSYSLSSGVNLHPLYEWAMTTIPEQFPEAQEGLDQFANLQNQYDIHLDEDLLQSFSGETVSITLPGGANTALGAAGESVSFMKCSNPDRVRELLHRLVDQLKQIPQVRDLALEEVEELEGFEAITSSVLAPTGMQPIIGFHDGWMVIATSPAAVQTVLDTRASSGPTIADSEAFQRFDLAVEGPVSAISYSNVGEGTRQAAMAIQQMGAMLPLFTAQLPPEAAGARDFLALIPSVGRIIGTLDFFEEQLSVTQPGPDELSYIRHSVTLVRPPSE
jgi:hypothetical protein